MWNTERDQEAKRHLLRWGKFYILDPAQQWTIDRIVNVCREVVTKYDVDGILYDDYFYPNGIASSVAAPDYKEWQNSGTDLSIGDWRRENVNRMVKAVYDMIQRENKENAEKFMNEVDAACVYVNASTRFTDGFEFGFGAEIGISTQKLHARGPMGLKELTSYKYKVYGNGQIRG